MGEILKKQKKQRGRFSDADEAIHAMKPGKKSGRKCKLCGKDPYPNYFYCPSCHHRVSHYSVEMDGEQEEFGLADY